MLMKNFPYYSDLKSSTICPLPGSREGWGGYFLVYLINFLVSFNFDFNNQFILTTLPFIVKAPLLLTVVDPPPSSFNSPSAFAEN